MIDLPFLSPLDTPDGRGYFIGPIAGADAVLVSVTIHKTRGDPPQPYVIPSNRIYGYCPTHGAHSADTPCPQCHQKEHTNGRR